MQPEQLAALASASLEELKAFDIRVIDVRGQTPITDFMVIGSGRSDRQVKAMADKVLEDARAAGVRPIGVEGQQTGEWVLIDLGDVIVHAMLPASRDFYQLEKLWEAAGEARNRAR